MYGGRLPRCLTASYGSCAAPAFTAWTLVSRPTHCAWRPGEPPATPARHSWGIGSACEPRLVAPRPGRCRRCWTALAATTTSARGAGRATYLCHRRPAVSLNEFKDMFEYPLLLSSSSSAWPMPAAPSSWAAAGVRGSAGRPREPTSSSKRKKRRRARLAAAHVREHGVRALLDLQ